MNSLVPLLMLFYFGMLNIQELNSANNQLSYKYVEDEDLLYEVSWTGINLGTIRIKTLRNNDTGIVKYKAVAYLDSYDGLPFVNLHFIAYTDMDSMFNSLGFYSLDKRGNKWLKLVYRYNLPGKKVYVEESLQSDSNVTTNQSTIKDTINLHKVPLQDGISLIYLARYHLRNPNAFSIATISNEKVGETYFDPSRVETSYLISNWKKPISVVQLKGKLKLEGIFGLKEDFIGWFSNDEAAIPIAAEMKVILGTVKIELKKWNRSNWKPPEFKKIKK